MECLTTAPLHGQTTAIPPGYAAAHLPPRKEAIADQETVGPGGDDKNWRGIIIALLVIFIICALVIGAIIWVTPKQNGEQLGIPISLEDVFGGQLTGEKFAVNWLSTTEQDVYVHRSREDGNVYEVHPDLNISHLVIEDAVFISLNADHYWISADANYVLIAYQVQQIHKYSFDAKYVIYNRHQLDVNKRLVQFPQSTTYDQWGQSTLQYAGWSPRGNALTFVHNNNLYYQPNPFTTAVRVSDITESKVITSGVPDWLYEHEILHSNKANWLSADGKYIAYIQFNDTNVPLATVTLQGDASDIYSQTIGVLYPKAGDSRANINPEVKLFVGETVNVKAPHVVIAPPSQLNNKEHYITSVKWRDNSHLFVTWSNRNQNMSIATLCDVKTSSCHQNLVLSSHEDLPGWTTIGDVWFVRKGRLCLTILDKKMSKGQYWKHIALLSAEAGISEHEHVTSLIYLTDGKYDVIKIVGVAEELAAERADHVITVFYISSQEDARRRHLYRVRYSLGAQRHNLSSSQCITCDRDDNCQYIDVNFSPSTLYYLETCLGPTVPRYSLRSTANETLDIQLEGNSALLRKMATLAIPIKEYFETVAADGKTVLYGQLLLPPGLKKHHLTKYPLIIEVPSWPGLQQVTYQFNGLDAWSAYMTSSADVIYATVDVRGSSGRGSHFERAIYRQLGKLETADIISTARYLKKKLSFIDEDKIAIWGSHYGGFLVANILGERDEDTIKCGIAVSPITDWRYYDTTFAERYMCFDSEEDNHQGYDYANVSTKAKSFATKEFLIAHGTSDEEVHFQHSALLMKALTDAEVLYESQLYVNRIDLLGKSHSTQHLYRTMTKFLLNYCWSKTITDSDDLTAENSDISIVL